jgi:hypothetical protein
MQSAAKYLARHHYILSNGLRCAGKMLRCALHDV